MKIFGMKKKEKDLQRNLIDYEPFIAGALLKYDRIDSVLFSLLIKDFTQKNNIDIRGYWNHFEVIKFDIEVLTDGTIKLKDGLSLDDIIEDKLADRFLTRREKFEIVAGNIVMDYFNNLNARGFRKKKDRLARYNKERVLNEANVLLISGDEEDYEALIKYGFKNVDYFKSLIRADRYFAQHPKELEKYHIIIEGDIIVTKAFHYGSIDLMNKIRNLPFSAKRKTYIFKTEYSNGAKFSTSVVDELTSKQIEGNPTSYEEVFDRIIDGTLINDTLDTINNEQGVLKFSPYQDYINPKRIPFPRKKSDLRILYLDKNNYLTCEFQKEIANKLGLNVTFYEDHNYALASWAQSHLGEYDIVIASANYSNHLLRMNDESTEQCKDTGRDLTLLVTYNHENIPHFDEEHEYDTQGFGDEVKLHYIFGGNYAPSDKRVSKKFRVLRKSWDKTPDKDDYFVKNTDSDISCIEAILKASVEIYNEEIKKHNAGIEDLDLITSAQIDAEYKDVDDAEEKRKNKALEPIKNFDYIKVMAENYLYYKKKGFIRKNPDGIKITEYGNNIEIKNIYGGRVLTIISFSKGYTNRNVRTFSIQIANKNGALSNPHVVAFYTRKYEGMEGIPERPNGKESNALMALIKKINITLGPVIDDARNREDQVENQKVMSFQKQEKRNPKSN